MLCLHTNREEPVVAGRPSLHLKSSVLHSLNYEGQEELRLYLTITPRARIGYEMIDEMISIKHEWNNCFITINHEILLDLADFALQEQLFSGSYSQAWYNCSYIMVARPIKSMELRYIMIEFL